MSELTRIVIYITRDETRIGFFPSAVLHFSRKRDENSEENKQNRVETSRFLPSNVKNR